MAKIEIPNSELSVSRICLGTGDFGGNVSPATSFAIMDRFIELSGNFIDTAHVYNDWIPGEKSRSEKLIGDWMALRKNRKQIVLSTKGAHPELNSMHIPRLSPGEIVHDLEESLRFLKTDYIDIYFLHRDDEFRPVEEIVQTLNGQVRAGKIRYFGVSNWSHERLKSANRYAKSSGLHSITANQLLWNVAHVDINALPDKTLRKMDDDTFAYHKETNLAVMAYSSQANGIFKRLSQYQGKKESIALPSHYPLIENLKIYEQIENIKKVTGYSTTQVLLGFLLSQPFCTIPIIGPKSLDQLNDSMSVNDVTFSDLPSMFKLKFGVGDAYTSKG